MVGRQPSSKLQGQTEFTSSIQPSLDFWETCQLGCLLGGISLAWMNSGLITDLNNNSKLTHLRNCHAQGACRHLAGMAGNSMISGLALH